MYSPLPHAVGVGWEMAFLGLALHIADPSAPKPNEKEFAVSPEGAHLHYWQQRGLGTGGHNGGDRTGGLPVPRRQGRRRLIRGRGDGWEGFGETLNNFILATGEIQNAIT